MNGMECDMPIVQVLGQKKIVSQQQTPDRYRLLLSDGVYTVSSAMLATHLNDKVTNGQIDVNAIIRLDKYICNVIGQEKKVLVIMEVTVIATPDVSGGKIGNPQPFKQSESAATTNNNNYSSSANNCRAPPNNYNPPPNNYNNNPTTNTSVGRVGVANAGNSSSNAGNASTPYGNFGNYHDSRPAQQNSSSFGGAQGQRGFSSGSKLNTSNNPDTPSRISAIASLSPYQNRWTIKARVTQKSAIKTWSNPRGEGQLFSINLLDESGEIRATAFKNEVTKFYNMIEVNKVYLLRKAMVKVANKQYCTFNDYELNFTGETEVIPCDEDDAIPTITFNFVPIKNLQDMQPNTAVDVIGVVKEAEDMKITNAQGRELKKRDLLLVDQSMVQIRLTLWSSDAENFDGSGFPIVAVKSCKLSDWRGRSLSQSSNSQLFINPDIPESHSLRGWFDHQGNSANFMEFKGDGASQVGQDAWKTFAEVKAQNLASDKADYFCAKATVATIKKDNCLYMACPECNKKIIDNGNGLYRCEKCAREYNNFKWRLILQMNLSDFSESIWVTCFQDTSEIILGKRAEEIGQMKDMDPVAFDQVFNEANFSSFIFKFRSKMETYNDESRLKTVCTGVSPINHVEYGSKVLAEIEKILGPI